MSEFNHLDYWKAITLFGLNVATYKPALGKVLLKVARSGKSEISWDDLSLQFFEDFRDRIEKTQMPQQSNPGRLSKLERIVKKHNLGKISKNEAIMTVGREGFKDVIPRFHTIGQNSNFAKDYFYKIEFGKKLIIKDSLLNISETAFIELEGELEARWSLLEGAFEIQQSPEYIALANDIRETYLANGYDRKPLTGNIQFLAGYQGNICFYCGHPMDEVHVDHVLPRSIVEHDEIWNLVLAHDHCNEMKTDLLVGPNFIEKLIQRNENIMGSNHPWKFKIQKMLGKTPAKRKTSLENEYEKVQIVRGRAYWGGDKHYNPETDPFYQKLITKLNQN